MAEGVLFNIAEEIIKTLGSLTAQEVALWWGLKDQLRKLNDTVTRIKAVIQDAEEQAQKQNHQIEVIWLMKLREAVYDAEDLLDDFSTQVVRKQLMPGKRVSREVRLFFSRSNQFVYGLRMGHRVKALRERLDNIETDSKIFHFEVRDEERASSTTAREQTTSSEPEKIVGRESDKEAVKNFLMNSNKDENVSVISVVGMGGLGKTTLAQHVFNDERVKANFGVRLWSIKVERGGNRISELTRHVSFDTELDLSLPSAQRLRTLVLLQGGKWDEGAWESICRDFRRLRVLVLSDFGMEEVSSLIEKLKHLKYLDLSNNEMEALPNSITTLVNLQVLKLNGCKKLKELPRDIGKLINLRHLDVGSYLDDDLCENLEYMPRGIGKLTSLQTLSCFVAAKNRSSKSVMIGGLDELSRLNELRGRLEIRVKGYDSGSCVSEFEGAKLKDKQYLHSLTIKWDIDSDSDIYLYDEMLPSLQPNSILQELVVAGYGGMRFPGWVSHLSNLARIRLERCRRLEHIPPLHGILALEELSIADMDSLEYIDSEGVGGRGVSMFFPSLKELHIFDCPRLKRWWEKSRDEMNDDSDESTKEMLCFPRLSSLSIVDCPNLTSMPLFPTLSILILSRASSMPLQETMKMTPPVSSSSSSLFIRPLSKLKNLYIYFIDDMEYLPEVGLQNLSSLQQLSIRGCSRLKSLPLPDQGMPSLQKLNISSCKELEYLSQSEYQGIPYLTSLQELEISYCRGELRMIEYGGMRFPSWSPSWLSHLSNLARIDLYGCRRLEHIPPLHGIPSLDELSIADMDSLEYIDSEGDGGRGVSMFFPSLKKLRIFDCPSLKGWWKNCRDEMNDDSEESTKEEELIILCFPCLSSLSIVYCPNLTSMPLFPTLDESLHLWETSSMPLQETMKMKSPVFSSSSSSSSSSFIRPLSKLKNLDIGAIRDMESLPEVGLQNLSSLQQLFIYECPSLKSLPLHDKGMHSLQILCIKSCSQLKSLSEESQGMTLSEYESQGMIPFLPSLQVLRIDDCNEELSGRTRGWGRESEEWPKIKHILNIVIDGYYIQEEGRYVKQISRGGLGYYSPYGY
uniref:Disease resistance protein RGA3 n=1 Tax=Populus alba TaxID=43335 RepID=A0A4U5QBX7_POPAL|nr:hypothetical protein D5086_0000128550 [Populus alba]